MRYAAIVVGAVAVVASAEVSALSTQVIDGSWGPFGTAQHFELKNGGSTWEVAQKNGGTVLDNIDIVQTDPTTYRFVLTHDATTGDVTLNLNDASTIWSLTWQTGEAAFGELWLLAKTSPRGGLIPAQEQVNLYNILLTNGGAPINLPSLQADTDPTKQALKISDDVFSNFRLEGNVYLSWTPGAPSAAAEAFFGWADPRDVQVVPTPATALAGLAMLGLVALRRRRMS